MSKKTIAVDIDEVLARNAKSFVDFSNERWGTNLTVDDYEEDWSNVWGIDDDVEIMRRAELYHNTDTFMGIEHISEAIPVLQELKSRYKLVVLTSRRKSVLRETHDWLDAYFQGVFEDVHFSGIWDKADSELSYKGNVSMSKADIAKEMGIDYLIDDQPKHAFAVAELGIKTLLFGDYRWSRDLDMPDNVVRVVDWDEVRLFFETEG